MGSVEKEKDFEIIMQADQVFAGWFTLGLIGWLISIISAMLYREEIVSPMWILLGPIILFIGLKSLVYGIRYAIKKKKSGRKYR